MINVSIVNQSTAYPDAQLPLLANALQFQVQRDFAPAWGTMARIWYTSSGKNPTASHWALALLDDTDQAGALGYHDITPTGQPLGKIFVKTTLAAPLRGAAGRGSGDVALSGEHVPGRLYLVRVALLDPLALPSRVGQQWGLLTPRCKELAYIGRAGVSICCMAGLGASGINRKVPGSEAFSNSLLRTRVV